MDYTETKIIEDGEVLIHRVYDDGSECYYDENDCYHRPNNKPAFIHPDGFTLYRVCGKLHRTNGPAFIYSDGSEEYWLDDIEYTEEDYWKEIERRNSK